MTKCLLDMGVATIAIGHFLSCLEPPKHAGLENTCPVH